MANKRKIDTATEADWSFYGDEYVMGAVRTAARKASDQFESVEYEDAEQDALLYLAIRPERVKRAHAEKDYRQLAQDIYTRGLRDAAVAESDIEPRGLLEDYAE